MARYLITQSLISSWNYLHSCYEGCEEDALNDFVNTLNRIPSEPNEAMLNGIEFENEVYKAAAGIARPAHPKWENGIQTVATLIRGAQVQVKAQRELTIAGIDLLVYGVLDALKAGSIFDVKFSNKGFSSAELAGKYLDSPQHPAYFYIVPEAREFTYLVSDGEDIYLERYTPSNTRPFAEVAKEFLTSLEDMKLLDLYKDKWITK